MCTPVLSTDTQPNILNQRGPQVDGEKLHFPCVDFSECEDSSSCVGRGSEAKWSALLSLQQRGGQKGQNETSRQSKAATACHYQL